MASTYSTNLKIDLMGTGDQDGTWGTVTNTNLGTLIEQAISGYVTQAITDGADTVITIPDGATGVARNMFIEMTSAGALTATRNLIVPANKKLYFIHNNTTGGFAVTVKVTGLTGVSVPNGRKVILVSNGTDIVEAHNAISGNATVGGTLVVTGATTASSFSGAGTGLTGTAASLTAGNVTTNANLTGMVTSVGNAASLGSFTSAQLAAAVTGETGTGALVFATSPTLVTPALGTPSSGNLSNCTNLPLVSLTAGVSGTLPVANGGTGVTSVTGSGSVVLSTSPTLVTPALGTPSAGTLTSCAGLPIDGGTTGTLPTNRGGTGVTAASTGTGGVVLSASPALTGVVTVGGTSIVGLEVGDTTSGVATATAYIDFHTGANIDYDARIVATGGTGSLGGGDFDVECATFDITGDLNVTGAKNFKIPHPLEQLSESKFLVHAAVESPVVQNLYQGMVRLVNGKATVNIDEKFGMTSGTFEALNRDFLRQTTNESGAANVWSSLNGAVLEVFCVDPNSTDEIYWMVSGERKDKKIYGAGSTDDNGRLIVEPVRDIEKERKMKADYEASKKSILSSNNS